jgi:hypothetical protein
MNHGKLNKGAYGSFSQSNVSPHNPGPSLDYWMNHGKLNKGAYGSFSQSNVSPHNPGPSLDYLSLSEYNLYGPVHLM